MIWDSHGQEQQANAETRFMIQAKGFWGGCVGRMRLVDGCRMCWGKIHIFRFSEVFFGVEGKDAKRFFFGTYKNHFANASIGTFGSLVYRSFFLNISHPFFWWFWKFDLNYSTRKWSPGTSIYQSSKVFWCSRFLDLLNKAILFFFLHFDLLNHDLNRHFLTLLFTREENGETPIFFWEISRGTLPTIPSRRSTLPETNIALAPENRPDPKRKQSYSNHPFLGANR